MTDEGQIYKAMGAAMIDIGAVAKDSRNQQQGFNFRGIDAVINAVGPVLRKHRIFVAPLAGTPEVSHYTTTKGTQMTHVLLPVCFNFYAEDGSYVTACTVGEAADAGDKVLSKAHSVAFRIALLQVFAIPTDDPDPDLDSHQRAPIELPDAAEAEVQALGWADFNEADEGWETLKAMCATPGESGQWAVGWAKAHSLTRSNFTPTMLAEMEVTMANAKKDGDWRAGYEPPSIEEKIPETPTEEN